MRSTVRPPVVSVPTLSPMVSKAVFGAHADPTTESKFVRGASARSRSPLPLSQRKPWGANAGAGRQGNMPTSPTNNSASAARADRSSSAPRTEPRRLSRNPSPALLPRKEGAAVIAQPTVSPATQPHPSLDAVLHRLDSIEGENRLLRALVLELTTQVNELKSGFRTTKDIQDSRMADLAERTNYVVGWVDHFNGLVAQEEQAQSIPPSSAGSNYPRTEESPNVARMLDMEHDASMNAMDVAQ